MTLAFATFEIKRADTDQRIIEGWCSTPSCDLAGDIVDPKGMQRPKGHIPLLWQHSHHAPIGKVLDVKASDKGVWFKAQLAKVDEPGTLKERLTECWQSIREGLVRGISIGFLPTDWENIPSGGRRFTKWILNEISAVTIPCNQDCSIATVKFYANGEPQGQPLTGPDAAIAEAWRRWDAELPMTPEQMQLTKLSPTGERLMTVAEQRAGQKLEAKTVPAVLQRQPVSFKPMSDIGAEMLAKDPGDAAFLKAAPSRDEVYSAIEAVSDSIRAIRLRTDELEKSGARFRGVYQRASAYRRGDQATHKGSLWVALSDVPEGAVPGEDPARWQLAAKGTG